MPPNSVLAICLYLGHVLVVVRRLVGNLAGIALANPSRSFVRVIFSRLSNRIEPSCLFGTPKRQRFQELRRQAPLEQGPPWAGTFPPPQNPARSGVTIRRPRRGLPVNRAADTKLFLGRTLRGRSGFRNKTTMQQAGSHQKAFPTATRQRPGYFMPSIPPCEIMARAGPLTGARHHKPFYRLAIPNRRDTRTHARPST